MLKKLKAKLPPMPTSPPTHAADRTTLLQLAFIIGLAVFTHFSIAKPAIAIFSLVIFLLKVGIIIRDKPAPPRLAMMLLTIFSLGMILFFYGGWNGQTAGISFLVLLVSLKFLESRILRDYYVVCLILYFLAASTFLFNSSIFSILSIVLYTIAITAILFKISTPTPLKSLDAIKASSGIIAKAVPLALLLFFFFPRVYGSFGFLPSQDETSGNQLDNSLVAGDLAASAFNNSLAFRAKFTGPPPSRDQLYWRSKVMPTERNFQWEVASPTVSDLSSAKLKQEAVDMRSGDARYNILHEQSGDLFLPHLDYVSGHSTGTILDDYSVFRRTASASTFEYSGVSTFTPSLPRSTQIDRSILVSTESQPTARLQALLRAWRSQARSETELLRLAYRYFSDNQFIYSLTPPGLDEFNPLDDFLFETRTGYCEHYASAFTTLMRWLGIPARVVVGYQGGTYNEAGDFFEVRYSDAHAWSEVWIDERWIRVDPTATVSPERIEFGMEALMELWDGNYLSSNASGKALADFLNPTGTARYLRKLNDTWNNVGYQWNKWIVNYDIEAQKELLSILGFEHRNSVYTLVGLMAFGAFALMLFYFWQLIPRAVRRGEAEKAYLMFTAKFKNHGIVKELADSPVEFAEKARSTFPGLSDEIDKITKAYQRIRYGKASQSNETEIQSFKRQVRLFKIQR